jgi:tetratricopeptide (TPR) repeat protein
MSDTDSSKLIKEIQEAAALLRSGRRGDALIIYHDVCKRSNRHPGVELQLGHLCEEFGDIDEAVLHYEVVAEDAPDNASYLATLGIAYLNAQEYSKARDTLEKAVEIDPEIAEAQHGLGVFHMRRSNYEGAIEYLERACELKPSDASARTNLGSSLANLNRHEEALTHIQRAVKLDKKNPLAQLTLSDILAQVGDMDASTRQVEEVVRKYPYFGGAYDHLARMRKFTTEDAPIMKKAEKALQRGMEPKERCNLLFALGKMHDDCGDFDKAFSFFEQANLLRKHAFDVDEDDKIRRALSKAFTAKSIAEYGQHGHASKQPVFVIGMPRSGTTLMERIIASHPLGAGSGELLEIPTIGHKVLPGTEVRKAIGYVQAELTPEKTIEYAEGYLDILKQGHGDAERIVDKMPGNFRFLGLVKSLFPNATIIHARRHPLDTCLSCYFQNFADLWWTNDLKVIGQIYTMYRKSMDHWREVFPDNVILDIRYEQLVEDPEKHARRMIDACGLEWDPSVLEFYKKKGVVRTASIAQTRQKIYKSSRARWMNYAQHLEPLVAEIAPYLEDDRELLQEHGVDLPSGSGLLKRLFG